MDDWELFLSTRDALARERLIVQYMGLVRYLAGRMGKDLPPHVAHEDLVSYGTFGLIDAVDRFDAERGVKFETFATPRIRGEILDGLRAEDWAPRSVRAAARRIAQGRAALEHRIGREPTLTELAEDLGLAESEVSIALWEAQSSHVIGLQAPGNDEHEEFTDQHPAHVPSSDLASDVEQQRLTGLLAKAIVGLPEQHRKVVALKYGEQLSLPEVGRRLGMGRGKATGLYVDACMMIRERLALLV